MESLNYMQSAFSVCLKGGENPLIYTTNFPTSSYACSYKSFTSLLCLSWERRMDSLNPELPLYWELSSPKILLIVALEGGGNTSKVGVLGRDCQLANIARPNVE